VIAPAVAGADVVALPVSVIVEDAVDDAPVVAAVLDDELLLPQALNAAIAPTTTADMTMCLGFTSPPSVGGSRIDARHRQEISGQSDRPA
jgi:hypothetical protein